jgi:hypothetical protein
MGSDQSTLPSSHQSIELRRLKLSHHGSSHVRVKEALITHIEPPTCRGHYVYKIERGTRDYLIYLPPNHRKFDQFRDQLQLKTIHRFIISTTSALHLGRERLPIWELLDVTPLSTTHRTVTITDVRPYRSRPHRNAVSTKISELVLSPHPIKIKLDSCPARVLIQSDLAAMLPRNTPVNLSLQYGGGHVYWVITAIHIPSSKLDIMA